MPLFLAADIGGTKSELALFEQNKNNYIPIAKERYPSGQFSSVSEIIQLFLEQTGSKPEFAGFGVAGPINDGVASVTNLPWTIGEADLMKEFGFSQVVLINDLTAVCASISVLGDDDLLELYAGTAQKDAMKGVVAPGTGLGEGYLLETGKQFLPQGSEGGHADFAPITEEQVELLAWMQNRVNPVSYEDLIAGPGIPNLYDFYIHAKNEEETPEIHEALKNVDDRTPVIVNGAFGDTPCPVCKKTVEMFLVILGSEAGNLALKLFSTGGMYIGGGIVPRLIGKISFDNMVKAYLAKGKMEALITSIPLRLITRKDAALVGVARYCEEVRARG